MCEKCNPHPCPCTTSPSREAAMVVVKPGVWCDPCIASIVAALNYGGHPTVASCCGHGSQPGRITLADGRTLTLTPAPEEETSDG